MNNPIADNDDDLNPSNETILEKVVFLKIQDSECGAVVWRYRKEMYQLQLESNRGFDTLQEAIESYLENHPNRRD